jgi:hypothetical protein
MLRRGGGYALLWSLRFAIYLQRDCRYPFLGVNLVVSNVTSSESSPLSEGHRCFVASSRVVNRKYSLTDLFSLQSVEGLPIQLLDFWVLVNVGICSFSLSLSGESFR